MSKQSEGPAAPAGGGARMRVEEEFLPHPTTIPAPPAPSGPLGATVPGARMRDLGDDSGLPRYKCHKQVNAAKILKVETREVDYVLDLEGGITKIVELSDKRPTPKEGWYMLVYNDGYVSYSPGPQFEEGYACIDPPGRNMSPQS